MNFLDRPVFICGAPRSGTTLLLNLLDGHPQLFALPIETHILQYVQAHRDGLDSFFKNEFLSCHDVRVTIDSEYRARFGNYLLNTYGAELAIDPLAVDPDVFRKTYLSWIGNNGVTLRGIYQAVAASFFESLRVKEAGLPERFVDKRPLENELCAMELKEQFPQAKFIHIVRDPRTRYASAKQRTIASRWRYRYCRTLNDVDFASGHSEISLFSFLLALRNQRLLPEDYLVVTYEGLMANTRSVMERASRFLGLAWDPILESQTRLGKECPPMSSFGSSERGIRDTHSDRLHRYWKLTSDLERKIITLHTHRVASTFGYVVDERMPQGTDLFRGLRHECFLDFFSNRLSLWQRFRLKGTLEEFVMDRILKRWAAGIPTQD